MQGGAMLKGPNLKAFRVLMGLTQEKLGQLAGLTQNRVSELERGCDPKPDELKRLLRVISKGA